MECYDRNWKADEYHRARISNPAMNPIFKLAPMGSGLSEFVRDELTGEGLTKSRPTADPLSDGVSLPGSRLVAPLSQILEGLDLPFVEEAADKTTHPLVKTTPPGNYHTHRDRPVGMEPLEVLQITIKEGVFVVPFNLESDAFSASNLPNVVNDMRLAFSLHAIDRAFDDELRLRPA